MTTEFPEISLLFVSSLQEIFGSEVPIPASEAVFPVPFHLG